jgi:hypothetical protein
VKSPTHWDLVGMALVESIRKGVFFDGKYWVRHSKGAHGLKPVYFSSMIMGDKLQKLRECRSELLFGAKC